MKVLAANISTLTTHAASLDAMQKLRDVVNRMPLRSSAQLGASYTPQYGDAIALTVNIPQPIARALLDAEILRVQNIMRELGVAFPGDADAAV